VYSDRCELQIRRSRSKQEVYLRSFISKIIYSAHKQRLTDVDAASENASAKTPDRLWSDLGDVHWGDDSGLSNTDTSDEATSIDLTKTTVVRQKDDDANDPQDAELSSSPETPDSVSKNEGEEGAGDGSYLHHGADVAFDIGVFYFLELVEAK